MKDFGRGQPLTLCRALSEGTDPHGGELGALRGRRQHLSLLLPLVLHLPAQTNLLVCDGFEEQPRPPELE